MSGDVVILRKQDRIVCESAIRDHCDHRNWHLVAVNARTNHVHVVVIADAGPKKVRDQLKANCTGKLRAQVDPLNRAKTWTKGGDIEFLDTEQDIYDAAIYVLDGQDVGNIIVQSPNKSA